MSEIKNLAPKAIWHNFYLLTQVPRPSGHLEKIQKFAILRLSKTKPAILLCVNPQLRVWRIAKS